MTIVTKTVYASNTNSFSFHLDVGHVDEIIVKAVTWEGAEPVVIQSSILNHQVLASCGASDSIQLHLNYHIKKSITGVHTFQILQFDNTLASAGDISMQLEFVTYD